VKAHRALGCSGYSRVDLLVTPAEECYVLEVNTLPGMTALSLLPEIAMKGAGLSFEALVERIIQTAHIKVKTGKMKDFASPGISAQEGDRQPGQGEKGTGGLRQVPASAEKGAACGRCDPGSGDGDVFRLQGLVQGDLLQFGPD
jgi:hypothetical protein